MNSLFVDVTRMIIDAARESKSSVERDSRIRRYEIRREEKVEVARGIHYRDETAKLRDPLTRETKRIRLLDVDPHYLAPPLSTALAMARKGSALRRGEAEMRMNLLL